MNYITIPFIHTRKLWKRTTEGRPSCTYTAKDEILTWLNEQMTEYQILETRSDASLVTPDDTLAVMFRLRWNNK